jgi:hypothetical protein
MDLHQVHKVQHDERAAILDAGAESEQHCMHKMAEFLGEKGIIPQEVIINFDLIIISMMSRCWTIIVLRRWTSFHLLP